MAEPLQVAPLDGRDVAEVRQHVLDVLAAAAHVTGDARYRIAAGNVTRCTVGRRARDDANSMALIRVMLESGDEPSVERAARRVASALPRGSEQSVAAATDRLARKYRRECALNL